MFIRVRALLAPLFAALLAVGATTLAAPPAHAAVPGDPSVDLVVAGNQMVYFEVSASDATSFAVYAYTASIGGSRVTGITGPDLGASFDGFVGPSDGLTNGIQYWLEVEAINSSGSTTSSTRTPFIPTTTTAAGTATVTSTSASGVDFGAQYFFENGDGDRLYTFTVMFDASTGNAWTLIAFSTNAYSNTSPLTVGSASVLSGIVNDTTYYIAAVNVGPDGFSPWGTRLAVTPQQTAWPPGSVIASAVALGADVTWGPITPLSGGSTITPTGYRIEYTTDAGTNWTTAIADTGSTDREASVTGLTAGTAYQFRVAAISASGLGGWAVMGSSVTALKNTQSVTWAPTNTSVTGTSGTIAPDSSATTDGDGTLSYSVTSAGTTGCTVNSSTGAVAYSGTGSCVVAAAATETATYYPGSASVTFAISAPAPAPAPSGGGSSSTTPTSEPTATPTVTPTPEAPVAPTVPTPVAVPGKPDNPSTPEVLTPGLVLVSSEVADSTPPRVMKKEPSPAIGKAPKVSAVVGAPVSLVTSGLAPGTVYTVKVKVNGKYVDLGSTATNADGQAQLPVFEATKKGTMTVAIIDPATGKTTYVKVKVQKPKKK